jgi:hypothetical protein
LYIPESFNVLVRELKGLGLNVELLDGEKRVENNNENKEPKQESENEAAMEKEKQILKAIEEGKADVSDMNNDGGLR